MAVCVDPHGFEVLDLEVGTEWARALADGLDQCSSVLDRHHEERGRQGVGEAGILGQDRHAAMILRRIQGIRIDDVMIALPVHDEIALIITGGDEGATIEVAGDRILVAGLGVAVFRTLHRADPLRAIAFDADRTHIPAEVQEEVFRALVLDQLCGIFRGIALADAADVQAHLRVLQIDGAGRFVDDDILDACMLRGFLQCGRIRQLGLRRILDARLPLVVPETQHCTVGDINLATGKGVDFLAPFYEGKQVRIDLDRLDAGVVIDSFQIVDALVAVIDVVELMLLQELCVGALIALLEIRFAFLEADLHGDGVEDIQKLFVVALELRRAAAARQAAGQCEAGAEKHQHLLQFYFFQSMFSP